MKNAYIKNLHLYMGMMQKFLLDQLSANEFDEKYRTQWECDRYAEWKMLEDGFRLREKNTSIIRSIMDMGYTSCDVYYEDATPGEYNPWEIDAVRLHEEIEELYRALVALANEYQRECPQDIYSLDNDERTSGLFQERDRTKTNAFIGNLHLYAGLMRMFLRRELSLDEFRDKYTSLYTSDRDTSMKEYENGLFRRENNVRVIGAIIENACPPSKNFFETLAPDLQQGVYKQIFYEKNESEQRAEIEEFYHALVVLVKEFSL